MDVGHKQNVGYCLYIKLCVKLWSVDGALCSVTICLYCVVCGIVSTRSSVVVLRATGRDVSTLRLRALIAPINKDYTAETHLFIHQAWKLCIVKLHSSTLCINV